MVNAHKKIVEEWKEFSSQLVKEQEGGEGVQKICTSI